MKISILSYDLSHNCLGRAYLLAKVLQRSYEVEIIGPCFGDGIWDPVDTNEFDYISIPGSIYPIFFTAIPKMLSAVNGDVIYAIKPRPTSYGISLLKKKSMEIPVVLDIDDWEVGFSSNSRFQFIKNSCLSIQNPNGLLSTYMMEKLTHLADEITVSSTFLQNKFGGTIIPHGKDTDLFNPNNFNSSLIRSKYGYSEEKLIVFFGTPNPHKGLDDLISAIKLLKRDDLKLIIVGAQDNKHTRTLRKLGGDIVHMYGLQPFTKVPEFLSMADMVVLPQKSNSSTFGQIPAKVFDAMAMAKPIIATKVSDLPEILQDCGLIVEPGDLNALASSIQCILENDFDAKKIGDKAREKCIREYSWNAMEKKLNSVFFKYE